MSHIFWKTNFMSHFFPKTKNVSHFSLKIENVSHFSPKNLKCESFFPKTENVSHYFGAGPSGRKKWCVLKVRGLGWVPGGLSHPLSAGALGVIGVGMFGSAVSVVFVAPHGWLAAVRRATHPRPTLAPWAP